MYLWDANIFISVSVYPLAFQGFWRDLEAEIKAGRVYSVTEVRREIASLQGPIRDLMSRYPDLFVTPTNDELQTVGAIMSDSRFEGFIKKKNWLNGNAVADPFLIAVAKHRKCTVVTNENTNPNGSRIPEACKAFKTKCVNFEGFMSEIGWKY